MAGVEMGLEAPSSVELLHVPKQITGRIRLATLIKTSLLTEFPVNRLSPEARQLSPDEGRKAASSTHVARYPDVCAPLCVKP